MTITQSLPPKIHRIIHLTNYNSSAKEKMQVKESQLDDEVEFDTLSLSDLALYSDDHDDLQRGEYEHEEEISQNEQDFEFSSQELACSNTNTTATIQDNIVFCGKLIAYKQPNLPEKIEREDQTNETEKCGWGLFRWNFSLRTTSTKRRVLFSKTIDRRNNAITHKSNKIQVSNRQKKKKKLLEREYYGFSGHNKVSILTSSSSGKAKWYLFLFGMSSFSTKIELRDMKNRLQRSSVHSPSRISPPTFRFQNYEEDAAAACKGRNRGWGLLELIKTLNCGRN